MIYLLNLMFAGIVCQRQKNYAIKLCRIEGVHKFVEFCFHLGHGMFKTGRYDVSVKVTEAVSRIFT